MKSLLKSWFWVAILLLPACSRVGQDTPGAGRVVIASKSFIESAILGEMLAVMIETHTDLQVDRKPDLGSNLAFDGIKAGEVDLYIDYTGTILVNYFKKKPSDDPAEVLKIVRKELDPLGLELLDPLGFSNTYTLTMREAQARELGITKISDLAAHADQLRPAFDPEFMKRPDDGYPALIKHYGFRFGIEPKQVSADLMYKLCGEGDVDVIDAFSTEGSIDKFKLKVLVDDKHFFPPYDAAPLVRKALLKKHPQLRNVLRRLAGRIDEATMRRLHLEVLEQKRPAREVAETFLKSAGLLAKGDAAK